MTSSPANDRLLAFAAALQAATTFEDLVLTTRAEIARGIGYTNVWLLVADTERPDTWRLVDPSGDSPRGTWATAPRIEIGGDPRLGELARGNAPLVIADPRTPTSGRRTIVLVPLLHLGSPFGALETGTFGDVEGCRPPSGEQLDYLIGMAQQLAPAARRVRLLEERSHLQQSFERLALLADSSQLFAGTTDIVALLDIVARRLSDVLGEGCAIRLLTADGTALDPKVTSSYHPDPAIRDAARLLATSEPLQLGAGIMGRVALTGESVLLPSISTAMVKQQTPTEYHPLIDRLGISSMLAVPLKARGRVLGVISITRGARSKPYDLDDQRLAQDVADRAALAIDSALLVRALRTSESRFRRLVDSGIVGIILADSSGRIREANDAFLSLLGYSRADLVEGRLHRDVLNAPEMEETEAAARAKLVAHGVASPWEKELVRKDGRRVSVLVGATLIDEGGGHAETLAFVVDLSAQKRAEEATNASEAHKTAVMEAALDAIVLMDHDGRILEFNEAAERTFGYSRDEVVGELLGDKLVPPSARGHHARGLDRYLLTGEQRVIGKRIEVAAMRKGGEEFPAEVAVVRIRGAGDPVFTGYIRDISERRRAAEAVLLRREKEAAEMANAELEAFSYSVAHDLRAPLRAISGFTGAFLEDHGVLLDDLAKAPLLRVTANVERMGHIIDALLALARLTRTQVRPQAVDLTRVATTVLEQLRASNPDRTVDSVVAEGLVGWGDPILLRAVLENLLENAWKFTRHRPRASIEVGVAGSGAETSYFVRDNGAGFNMAFMNRLFSPFQRLHSAEEFEGTGVGLATVARIVRRHGGLVWAEGVENGGATFHFTLAPANGALS